MPFQACLPLACFGDDWLLVVELCLQLLTKWTIDCFQLVCLWGLLLRLRFCMQSRYSTEGNNICKMKVNREFNFLSNNIKITYSAFIKSEADLKCLLEIPAGYLKWHWKDAACDLCYFFILLSALYYWSSCTVVMLCGVSALHCLDFVLLFPEATIPQLLFTKSSLNVCFVASAVFIIFSMLMCFLSVIVVLCSLWFQTNYIPDFGNSFSGMSSTIYEKALWNSFMQCPSKSASMYL